MGFGSSTFRYAAPGTEWTVADLAGKRIATSYPNLVRADLGAGIEAELSASAAPSKSRSSWVSQMRSPTWSDRVARCANTRWWLSAIPV